MNPKHFSFFGFVKLTRAGNLLIIGVSQYFTAYFLASDSSVFTNFSLFMLSMSCILIAAAGYIINDYYDVKIDYINKPKRVVVGKLIKRRTVMATHTVLNVTGIAMGFMVSPWVAIINFFCALLLWLYSNLLKRLPLVGNLSVALLTGASIYMVDLLYPDFQQLILIYALFAAGFTFIREVVKDLEDVRGDNVFGCKTLPIVVGMRKTKAVVSGFSILFLVGISSLLLHYFDTRLIWLILGNIVAVLVILSLLIKADTIRQFHRLSTLIKVIMLFGVLSMTLV